MTNLYAFSGPHSQGKTTLLRDLQNSGKFPNGHFYSSFVRELKVPLNEGGNKSTQLSVMEKHRFLAAQGISVFPDPVFLDRCALDCMAYTLCQSDTVHPRVLDWFRELIPQYRCIFYTGDELPVLKDGVRSENLLYFKQVVDQFENLITLYNIPVIRLSGSTEKRLNQVIFHVQNQNPHLI
jgi:predicted ATPase